MILSLLKILFFFAVVLAIALGAVQLSETGQTLRLEYGGTEYVLTPVKALVALLVLMVAAWLVLRLLGLALAFLRFLAGDETAINRYFARSRERKGYEALGEGMLAVASGEGKLAQDKAAKARKYLDMPHVTNVLAAQAAEVAGDRSQAEAAYRTLLEDDRTRFVGVRGLMRQKLDAGDTATALLLAQKAYALKPRHKEIQDTLLELEMREHDWKGARKLLKEKSRQGELPKDVHLRRDAVLALQEASEVLASGNSISAREAAISAAKASPDLIPAAVLAAQSYTEAKDYRNASRILEKTWSVRPHPDIAAAYAAIVPDETPNARLTRFERLIGKNPSDEESRLLKAELLLAAEDFPGARRALGDLAQSHPTVRTLSIMAAVERGEGADDSVVRGWLAKALTASRGPQWVCDTCHNVMADWGPVCDSCGGFDTLSWREPEMRRSAATAGTAGPEMLPLLVGSPATTPDAAAADAPPADGAATDAAAAPAPAAPAARTAPPADSPRSTRIEIADVAPGMVPREQDFVEIEPATTDTSPERPVDGSRARTAPPDSAAPLAGTPVPDRAVSRKPVPDRTATAGTADAEPVPVRPDVEPPSEGAWQGDRARG
ncbi:heme biosynthesis protein HemY [Paracoccus spongiarum]|uniref:Heme biosynthesis HemY N-terminal domain-containing protein n=1 Tax=Paracoccus spongiarum TaxID=3064387 RepID=A0ABT9JCC6_9RHOB|nr:heme biosynthesis HemY N-terminal domain-containing protein [Paracoccus sp. 2205BS29-5]MDP5307465.1 heme biosynthesis HemY N-terminal domain-containing protein [Paracoccus sp. 2205BS29-5]